MAQVIYAIITESPKFPDQRDIRPDIEFANCELAHKWLIDAREYYDSIGEVKYLWLIHDGPYVPGLWKWYARSGPSWLESRSVKLVSKSHGPHVDKDERKPRKKNSAIKSKNELSEIEIIRS